MSPQFCRVGKIKPNKNILANKKVTEINPEKFEDVPYHLDSSSKKLHGDF